MYASWRKTTYAFGAIFLSKHLAWFVSKASSTYVARRNLRYALVNRRMNCFFMILDNMH